MLSYKLLKKQQNDFVKEKKIPLGINTYRGNNPEKKHIVTIPHKKRGSIVIIATSQWGKSTLLKRILNYRYLFKKNKAWLTIDTQGRDHRYLGNPNNHSKPLFTSYGELPMGIEDIVSYCLMFASKRAFPKDKIIGITLNDLNPRDLLSSDIEDNQMREFFKIKQMSENNRRIMDNPKEFFIEFAKIPSRKRDGTISSLDYPADTLMNYGIKEALETKFSWWMGYQPSDNEKPDWMGKEQWNLQKL